MAKVADDNFISELLEDQLSLATEHEALGLADSADIDAAHAAILKHFELHHHVRLVDG